MLMMSLCIVAACTVSYKFNGSSINYDKVKTISFENFPNRSAAFVWGPMESMFNTALQDKYVKQQEAASFEISPKGDVVSFTMKKDMPAEVFKDLFYIEDGALRAPLRREALADGIGVEKDATGERLNAPFASYDEAMMNGVTSFSNGVYLEPVGDRGNYQPVYSKSILYKGDEIPISSDKVDPHKDTPWYKKWFGMED